MTATPATTDAALEDFFQQLQRAWQDGQLQKLVLSKYQGLDPEWQRLQIRPVQLKTECLLQFVWQDPHL